MMDVAASTAPASPPARRAVRHSLLTGLAVALSLVPTSAAPSYEPDGFRGLTWGTSAIVIAAADLGHAGAVRLLIRAGAPLDHVNNLHWTAVIEAIVLGDGGPRHQATLHALLEAGASTRLTDRDGRTPLELARGRGYDEMVRLLTRAGARDVMPSSWCTNRCCVRRLERGIGSAPGPRPVSA